jgi:putative ABC transport system ATP-binding protein
MSQSGILITKVAKKIMELFKTLNQKYHKTILMVTHNLESTSYSQRTLHMLDGKVIDDEKKSK